MKTADMMKDINEYRATALRLFQTAQTGYMTHTMSYTELYSSAGSLHDEYTKARNFATFCKTRSQKVWGIVHEMSKMEDEVRGYGHQVRVE